MRVWGNFAIRSLFAATTALTTSVWISGSSVAAITVTQSTAGTGKLTLRGRADPGSTISLDGGVASVKARSSGTFDFGLLHYIPGRCVVRLTSPTQPSIVVNVANCAPIALKSRGEWSDVASYVTDELVFHDGS